MAPKRRTLLQILALAVALLVLAFVVTRGGAPQKPAAQPADQPTADPAMTARPAPSPAPAATSEQRDFGIIGPATKADPHTIRRAVESLSDPAPAQSAPAAPSATGKP